MGTRVGVVGASGYAGGELLRLLCAHPDVEIGTLVAGSSAGLAVSAVHPHLPALAGRVFEPEPGDDDLVFVALPPGESVALPDVPVIDLGPDHRAEWPYGLPELFPVTGPKVAVAGCYPTAIALALAPLVREGVVAPEGIVVVAASGVSGAGRGKTSAAAMGDLSAYGVTNHRHVPEIERALGSGPVSFTPVLAPMPRGILATCTAPWLGGDPQEALATAYDGEPFVHVLDAWPHTSATVGSNACHLRAAVDERAGRVVVVSALDNLGKGAAGQAVQCANLALGLPETSGLSSCGVR